MGSVEPVEGVICDYNSSPAVKATILSRCSAGLNERRCSRTRSTKMDGKPRPTRAIAVQSLGHAIARGATVIHSPIASATGKCLVASTKRPVTTAVLLNRLPRRVDEAPPIRCSQSALGRCTVRQPLSHARQQRSTSSDPAKNRSSKPPSESKCVLLTAIDLFTQTARRPPFEPLAPGNNRAH